MARNSSQIKQPRQYMRHPTICPIKNVNSEEISISIKEEERTAIKMFTNSILKKKRTVKILFCFARRLLKYYIIFINRMHFSFTSVLHRSFNPLITITTIKQPLSSLMRVFGDLAILRDRIYVTLICITLHHQI